MRFGLADVLATQGGNGGIINPGSCTLRLETRLLVVSQMVDFSLSLQFNDGQIHGCWRWMRMGTQDKVHGSHAHSVACMMCSSCPSFLFSYSISMWVVVVYTSFTYYVEQASNHLRQCAIYTRLIDHEPRYNSHLISFQEHHLIIQLVANQTSQLVVTRRLNIGHTLRQTRGKKDPPYLDTIACLCVCALHRCVQWSPVREREREREGASLGNHLSFFSY